VFLDALGSIQRIERFAITGGVPRYLSELGQGALKRMVCSRVLDRDGPLWNEARAVLQRELVQAGVDFSILEQLALGERDVEEIASGARMDGSILKDIEDHKLPALRQAGYEIDEQPQLLLFSRSGYNGTVKAAAAANERIRLVSVAEITG
jgi:hypothetical protein